jgi:drug/metabolite transporter (DMT)-like permease
VAGVLRADLALLAVAAVWGATFVMVKDALAFAGPFAFLTLRFWLATLLLAPLLAWAPRRAALTQPGLLRAGAVLGLLLCGGYGFQTAGLQFTTPARAAFITGLSVVIVPLLTALVLRKRVGMGVWLGVGLATVGLALLSLGPEVLNGGSLIQASTLLGDLLVLGCAFVFGGHVFLAGEYAPRLDVLTLTWVQLAVAALLATCMTLAIERPALEQLTPMLPAAAFTGLFATVVAFTIQLRAQRFTSATHTALIFSTEPVFGALFAFVLAGEVLAPAAILGCGLILAGMLLAQLADALTWEKPPMQGG